MKQLTNGLTAIAAVAAVGLFGAAAHEAQSAPAKPALSATKVVSARQTVEAAARAMGGIEKLRAIKTITLTGYGQYAYMFGGGRLTGSPDAPEKFMAANDLRRVYDLENDRFQMLERRNMVFPFLAPFGHSFFLNNNILDGDVAFDMAGDRAVRQARWSESPLTIDGVHMRRMWSMNNPAVLVRAMLDPATRLSAPRRDGGRTVIDVTLKQGDKLTAAFEAGGLPAWVRWSNPHTDLGQANFTTSFTGWSAADGQGGILLPLGYDTRLDWRNVDYFKLYVDAYKIDAPIADLAAPAAVKAAPEPESYAVAPMKSVPVAKGIWRITNGGTTVVEFKDHLVLFELPTQVKTAKAVLAYARTLAPGKPITMLIASHNHFDHTMGLRQAVAEGITIVQRKGSEGQFREMASHPAPDFPDDLARNPKPMKFVAVDEHLRLSDETQTLDVYWGRSNPHMGDVLFAYAPAQKVMMEGDLVTAAYDWQHWPDTFRDVIAYYKLDVEKISPVHSVWPEHPDVLTHAQAEELLKGGTERARQRCAAEQAKGYYLPGCPVQSKYY